MVKKCKKGFKRKKGKCIRSGSFKRSSKKSFNPFKMWGSYVGAAVSLLLIILMFVLGRIGRTGQSRGIIFTSPVRTQLFTFGGILAKPFGLFGIPIGMIIWIILGFLIGWGIHSLFRFLKRRR